jgi:hypothetical protein
MTQAANLAALGTNAGTTGILPAAGGGTAGTAGVTGFKNRIINGNMTIDQRNAGASVAFSSGTAFGADRFVSYNQTSGAYTIQQVADAPAGFKYSNKITTTTAGSTGTAGWTSFLQQRIEGFNIADLGAGTADAKTVTLSFWVKSSLTGSMPIVFLNDVDRLYATTYTVNSANTWEQKTITLTLSTSGTWNSTNGRGLLISWGLGSGSTYSTSTVNSWQNLDGLYFVTGSVAVGGTLNATWQVTGVQFEVGTAATNFDFRSYGTELALCQRYFWLLTPATGNSTPYNMLWYTSLARFAITCPVPMRATPTITSTGAAAGFFFSTVDDITYTNMTLAGAGGEQGRSVTAVNISGSTSTAAGGGVMYIQNSRLFTISAEL